MLNISPGLGTQQRCLKELCESNGIYQTSAHKILYLKPMHSECVDNCINCR